MADDEEASIWSRIVGSRLFGWADRIPWHWAVIAVLAVLVLGSIGYCRNDSPVADFVETRIQTVPLSALQGIVERMADTQIGLIDRIKGLESRPPKRIVVTDTIVADPPDACLGSVELDRGARTISVPIFDRVAAGWTVRLLQDFDVTGCDDVRVVGDQLICDRPRIGKWQVVLGSEIASPGAPLGWPEWSAYGGIGWRQHRDSRLSFMLGARVDPQLRYVVRAEYRWP